MSLFLFISHSHFSFFMFSNLDSIAIVTMVIVMGVMVMALTARDGRLRNGHNGNSNNIKEHSARQGINKRNLIRERERERRMSRSDVVIKLCNRFHMQEIMYILKAIKERKNERTKNNSEHAFR